MKTRHVVLALSLLTAAACEAAVTDGTDGTSATAGMDTETSASSSSTGGDGPQTTSDPSTTGRSSSTSQGSAETSTSGNSSSSAESSSSGAPVECGSPLLDPDDRLQLADAPMRGNPDALVTVLVWTGYADPFSRALQSTLAALAAGPQAAEIRVVSKQMPLAFQDPDARLARAGLAALELGAYWAFHDAMFAAQGELDPETVDAIATDVGLDLDAFHGAMESAEVAARLAQDMALFTAVGGTGTPSSIVNGEFVSGAQPLGAFEEVVSVQRSAMEALIEAGTQPCVAFEQRLGEQLP